MFPMMSNLLLPGLQAARAAFVIGTRPEISVLESVTAVPPALVRKAAGSGKSIFMRSVYALQMSGQQKQNTRHSWDRIRQESGRQRNTRKNRGKNQKKPEKAGERKLAQPDKNSLVPDEQAT